MPIWIRFGNDSNNNTASFQLPILLGLGVEYFLKSNLLAYFALKMGPTVFTDQGTAVFTLVANIGVGYRF